MDALTVRPVARKGLQRIAQAGFVAKGIVYTLLGVIAIMAALHVGNQSTSNADKAGVFQTLKEMFGGNWILLLVAVGLVCYSAWRLIESYHNFSIGGKHKWSGFRYFFSGAIYLSVAVAAFRMATSTGGDNGDNQQQLASELLSKPYGQWLLGIAALIIAGVGFYQIYYGLSEKYTKHVQKLSLHDRASRLMLFSGKLGYTARGVVWLVIAFLSLRAAIKASSAAAGDTGKAFGLIENSSYGTYLLAFLGIGLAAYGFFNFVRARYEEFNQALR